MNPQHPSVLSPRGVARLLVVHVKRWLIPAMVVGALATVYAVKRPAVWEASQGLIVRNEAVNNQENPGKFAGTDEMKTVQETILELVKSRGVLGTALQEVGPPADYQRNPVAWPSERDVADLREAIKLTPPNGAEFGTTEVFYLVVRDCDRKRAVALSQAICDQLQARFQQLRDTKAQSMIAELVNTVELAKADLTESTERLMEMEKRVGSDLAELRALNEAGTGESTIRRTISEIRAELRQTEAVEKANQQLLTLLREAQEDPGRLLAAPNRLLESQPALKRLKDGLIDAQIRTAKLKGTMSDEHPLVRSARQSEEEIGRHLHDELAIAIRGLQIDLRMNADRLALLGAQLADGNGRLTRLAELRAAYANLVADTNNCTQRVEQAERNLADARASHAGATAASLITKIDSPEAGIHPVGPSRSMIALAGIAGGLLTGFGILFLTLPPTQPIPPALENAESAAPEATSPPVTVESNAPAFQPGDNLSFKQALHKIHYGSTA